MMQSYKPGVGRASPDGWCAASLARKRSIDPRAGCLISNDLDTGLLGPAQPRKIALPTYVCLPADSQCGDDTL